MLKLFCLCAVLVSVVQSQSFNPPLQIHLSLTGDPTEMVVSWMTQLITEDTVVKVYGSSFFNTFTGEQSTYQRTAGWVHHTVLTGLTPSTTYNYECGSSDGGFSEFASFKTPPVVGSRDNRTFIFYGDMGIYRYSYDTVQHVNKIVLDTSIDVDLIYHAGDFGYGDVRPPQYYEASWDEIFYQMQPVMQQIPYMVAPGNHEAGCGSSECDYYAKNFTVYNNRFRMPGKESGSNTNMWYSFDYANIHMITISTETDYPNCPYPEDMFGNQLAWLESDLAKASVDENIDWIFIQAHQPIYSSISSKSSGGVPIGPSRNVQLAFENLLHTYGVDVYFDGHVHGYERTYPVYQSKVVGSQPLNEYTNPGATVYVINGNAGNVEGFYDDWNFVPPAWSAVRYWPNPEHGYGILETYGASKLKWTWYSNSEQTLGDNPYDWFTLEKQATVP